MQSVSKKVVFSNISFLTHVEVSERALEIFKQYISKVKKLPNTFAVKTMKEACDNPLAEARIVFFCSAASALEPFLQRSETDAPMALFLHAELFSVFPLFW